MKKLLLFTMLTISLGLNAQNLYTQNFDVTTAALLSSGWSQTNQSIAVGAGSWLIPSTAPTATTAFGGLASAGQAGGPFSFALVNYTSASNTGTTNIISNWLITPTITVKNGDVVSFYSRKGTDGTTDFADRLEVRLSSAATTIVPSTGSADVGSFTTLGVSINPTLAAGFVYPKTWTLYSFTVSGLPTDTPCKLGFRYFVTSGGLNGNNSDIIGIDTLSVDRTPLATSSFTDSKFSISPNPANDFINISNAENIKVSSVKITDLNGRVVKQTTFDSVSDISMNVLDLSSGIYMMNINSNEGSVTKKIIKN